MDPDSPKAKKTRGNFFHSIVMLLMCVSHRGRRDIQLAMTLFSVRLNCVTEQDCKKLRRVIRCILDSIDELLFLGAIDMDILMNLIEK